MKKYQIRSLLILCCVLAFSIASYGQIEVKIRPTPPRIERPLAPSSHHIWIDGEWAWRGGNYEYVNGYWSEPREGNRWIPGHWKSRGGGWVWIPGHWRHSR